MNFIVIVLLALSLAMDAFAVSIAHGLSTKKLCFKQAFIMALFFGVFQALMPVLGWLIGNVFNSIISEFDSWIVFVILFAIGVKMIYETFQEEHEEKEKRLSLYTLFMLAIATSIDAFAVGVGFSLLKTEILFPVLIIGLITFILSFIGVCIGKKVGTIFGRKMEALGGVILIIIAISVLFENFLY